jgi:hypothetical protein
MPSAGRLALNCEVIWLWHAFIQIGLQDNALCVTHCVVCTGKEEVALQRLGLRVSNIKAKLACNNVPSFCLRHTQRHNTVHITQSVQHEADG